jgi:hypothetical protein
MKFHMFPPVLVIMLIAPGAARVSAQAAESISGNVPSWHLSLQYLGLTFHPGGGGSPGVYPLKFEKKGYLVPEVGAAANLDYRLSDSFFFRFTSALYKDCAFVTAGCIHAGPRIQYSRGDHSINAGIGPIFSFREDWHRFKEYQDDEFYGDRVRNGWQYRFFPTALELEYLHRINDSTELQWSVIPGAPLVITFMFGVRFILGRTDAEKKI